MNMQIASLVPDRRSSDGAEHHRLEERVRFRRSIGILDRISATRLDDKIRISVDDCDTFAQAGFSLASFTFDFTVYYADGSTEKRTIPSTDCFAEIFVPAVRTAGPGTTATATSCTVKVTMQYAAQPGSASVSRSLQIQ